MFGKVVNALYYTCLVLLSVGMVLNYKDYSSLRWGLMLIIVFCAGCLFEQDCKKHYSKKASDETTNV